MMLNPQERRLNDNIVTLRSQHTAAVPFSCTASSSA